MTGLTAEPGYAQTTLIALAKRQFGGLKRHLWHTLELGPEGAISTKKCPISNPGGKILIKNVLFTSLQPRRQNFVLINYVVLFTTQGAQF